MNIRFSTTFFSALMLFSSGAFASQQVMEIKEKKPCKCCVGFGENLQDIGRLYNNLPKGSDKPGLGKVYIFATNSYMDADETWRTGAEAGKLLKEYLFCKKTEDKHRVTFDGKIINLEDPLKAFCNHSHHPSYVVFWLNHLKDTTFHPQYEE